MEEHWYGIPEVSGSSPGPVKFSFPIFQIVWEFLVGFSLVCLKVYEVRFAKIVQILLIRQSTRVYYNVQVSTVHLLAMYTHNCTCTCT